MTFFAFAIDIDTSSSFLRKPNSAWSVDASRCGRSRWVMGIVVYVLIAVQQAEQQDERSWVGLTSTPGLWEAVRCK
jgi:hypothetical protein